MKTDHNSPSRDIDEPSCPYTVHNSPTVGQQKGIMKSNPKVDKIVSKMWKRQQPMEDTPPTQNNMRVLTIEDTSTEDSPGQPAKKIEAINLESTEEQTRVETNIRNDEANETLNASTPSNTQNTEEEHKPAITSPAKCSISDLHARDFFKPSEFWARLEILAVGGMCDGGTIIRAINLESTEEQTRVETNIRNDEANETLNASTPSNTQNTEEEHKPAITSPAKCSISDLHARDFFKPSEFWARLEILAVGGMCDGGTIIRAINLESTDEQIRVETNISNDQANETENASTPADTQNTEGEHEPAITSPAKSSISDLPARDFLNPSEFWVLLKFLAVGGMCDGGTKIPRGFL